jgi:hypothetical protein
MYNVCRCEVQFDYGLRQRRSRKLEERLPSIRLDSGKEIVVQQDVAARNDKTTKRGRVGLYDRGETFTNMTVPGHPQGA